MSGFFTVWIINHYIYKVIKVYDTVAYLIAAFCRYLFYSGQSFSISIQFAYSALSLKHLSLQILCCMTIGLFCVPCILVPYVWCRIHTLRRSVKRNLIPSKQCNRGSCINRYSLSLSHSLYLCLCLSLSLSLSVSLSVYLSVSVSPLPIQFLYYFYQILHRRREGLRNSIPRMLNTGSKFLKVNKDEGIVPKYRSNRHSSKNSRHTIKIFLTTFFIFKMPSITMFPPLINVSYVT